MSLNTHKRVYKTETQLRAHDLRAPIVVVVVVVVVVVLVAVARPNASITPAKINGANKLGAGANGANK